MNKIACIGSGNMGFALMKGAAKKTKIFITDADAQKAQHAAKQLGAKVLASNTEAAKTGNLIFLAVKPQILSQVLAEIADVVKERQSEKIKPVLISMAAGWSIEKIQSAIGEKVPVVRMMPNTPALIGKGMIAVSPSKEVSKESILELEKILGAAGIVDIIEESFMDAVTGLSGSGPAFVYLFIEALAAGGVNAGLTKEKALSYAVQTALGAASMVQETGKDPIDLKNMVTSPNGTTVAGIGALEKGGFRAAVIGAVEAAWKRSIELG